MCLLNVIKMETKQKIIKKGGIFSFRLTNELLYSLYDLVKSDDKFECKMQLDKKNKRVIIKLNKVNKK